MSGHPQPSPGDKPTAPRQSQVGLHHVLRECPHTAKSDILIGFAQGDHGRVPTHQGTRKTDAESSREGHWTLAGPLCLWQFLKGQRRRLGAQASSLSLGLRQGVQVHTTPRFPVPSPRTQMRLQGPPRLVWGQLWMPPSSVWQCQGTEGMAEGTASLSIQLFICLSLPMCPP